MVVMFFDQLLVRGGSVVTRVFLTAYTHPFRPAFEDSLLHAIAKRLQAGGIGAGPIA